MLKVAVIGECMVELSKQANGQYKMGFGGDTLNTAIYLTRCGGHADYFTVLSDDIYSQQMLSQWQQEGVGTEQVKINDNKLPGLYVINNDEHGERYFNYWRENSAARTLLSDYPEVLDSLIHYDVIFLSGITLSLYSNEDLVTLFAFLNQYRKAGGIVAFDNNYRPNNWPDFSHSVSIFNKMRSLTDIGLISFDDECLMYGEHSIDDCIQRWSQAGVNEVVVKNGHNGCHVYIDNQRYFYPLDAVLSPIDTTAAGDSFNGAYLAAKSKNKSLSQSIVDAQSCASTVIMYKGAVIDKSISLLKEAI
ncbi:sugar kinase [Shewanella sp. UCD-KL21]|uniref:sugar kinase n=1 Tax=Shewanella sp. UCD-KL21 TaxID=1917164 RepID=UPI000971306D|nr:sugar kinase [Shewanella sp. UCD-KL21]